VSGVDFSYDPLRQAAAASANRYGVPVDLFMWQINQESSFNPNPPCVDSRLCVIGGGIAQFQIVTAGQYGLTNRLDPYAALDAAAHYDSDLYANTGNWLTALGAYGTIPQNNPSDPRYQAAASIVQNLGTNTAPANSGCTPSLLPPGSPFQDAIDWGKRLFGAEVNNCPGTSIAAGPAGASGYTQKDWAAENAQGLNALLSELNTILTALLHGGLPRIALVLLGLILVAGALYLFGRQAAA